MGNPLCEMSRLLLLLCILSALSFLVAEDSFAEKMKLSYNFVDPPPERLRPDLAPVLLLHGMMDSRLTWEKIAPRIANATGRKVYYLDARDHGDSPWSEGFNLDDLANDLIEFMDNQSIPRATLVGHSMGGRTAITLALRKPERVEKIVVEDMTPRDVSLRTISTQGGGVVLTILRLMQESLSVIPEGANERKAKIAIALYLQPLLPKEMIPKTKNFDMAFQLKSMPLKRVGDRYMWKMNMELLEKSLTCEHCFVQNLTGSYLGDALFLSGKESFIRVSRDKALIKKLFPNSELIELEGFNHLIHHQDSELFIEKVSEFINGNSSSDISPHDKINMSYVIVEPPSDLRLDLPPVILVHGMLDSKASWSRIAPRIANLTGRTVYRLDARNHGESPWSEIFNMDVLAEDLSDFMENERIPEAVFVGHSMGGKAAMTLALRKPEKVEKLIVEDMSPKNLSPEGYPYMASGMKSLRQMLEELPKDMDEISARKRIATALDNAMPEEDRMTSEEMKEFRMRELAIKRVGDKFVWMANIDVLERAFQETGKFDQRLGGQFPKDALFIYGTKSYVNVSNDEPLIRQHFPKVQMVAIEDAGHLIHYVHEERFLHEIVHFINCSSEKGTETRCKSKL